MSAITKNDFQDDWQHDSWPKTAAKGLLYPNQKFEFFELLMFGSIWTPGFNFDLTSHKSEILHSLIFT